MKARCVYAVYCLVGSAFALAASGDDVFVEMVSSDTFDTSTAPHDTTDSSIGDGRHAAMFTWAKERAFWDDCVQVKDALARTRFTPREYGSILCSAAQGFGYNVFRYLVHHPSTDINTCRSDGKNALECLVSHTGFPGTYEAATDFLECGGVCPASEELAAWVVSASQAEVALRDILHEEQPRRAQLAYKIAHYPTQAAALLASSRVTGRIVMACVDPDRIARLTRNEHRIYLTCTGLRDYATTYRLTQLRRLFSARARRLAACYQATGLPSSLIGTMNAFLGYVTLQTDEYEPHRFTQSAFVFGNGDRDDDGESVCPCAIV